MFNAYVLHTLVYKETSLIVKFFTKEHGVVSLVANGAKRKKSQFANILQPFIPLLLYWKNHSLDLSTLHKAEALSPPYKLSRVYLFSSLYVNELLFKLLATHDPNTELFNYYQVFLENLSNLSKTNGSSIQLEKNLRFMEKQILKAIGYELQLDRESCNGDIIDTNANYYFDLESGINLHKLQGSETPQIFISGKSLLALHSDNFIDAIQMQEAKLFMRKILANFLGNRPLASRKLFV